MGIEQKYERYQFLRNYYLRLARKFRRLDQEYGVYKKSVRALQSHLLNIRQGFAGVREAHANPAS